MTTKTTVAAELPDPSPDQLRAIARTARNSSGSASDDCGPLAYVLHGWRAAAIAFRAQQPAQVEALSAAQAGVPDDPMDWPLPCDVTVGHGTMCKGVSLRTLVTRMKVLYEMATGNNADEVANRTPEQRTALADAFRASITAASQPSPSPAPAQPGQEGERTLGVYCGISPDDVKDPTHPRYVAGFKAGHASGSKRAARAAPQPATADAVRLDHLQGTGSTIDLLPGETEFHPMRFRVGGLHKAVSTDVREAIDAALAAQREVKP